MSNTIQSAIIRELREQRDRLTAQLQRATDRLGKWPAHCAEQIRKARIDEKTKGVQLRERFLREHTVLSKWSDLTSYQRDTVRNAWPQTTSNSVLEQFVYGVHRSGEIIYRQLIQQ